MPEVIRAMSKIHQNVPPRTKDATAEEEKDTSKRNVEVECNRINQSAQSSSFRRTLANTNAVVAVREKSDDSSKDNVFILIN